MGIRSWLTQLQAPLYKRIVTAEEKIHLRDEAQHRLRANKLRKKAGLEPLGQPTAEDRAKAAAVKEARQPGLRRIRQQVDEINAPKPATIDPVADVARRKARENP